MTRWGASLGGLGLAGVLAALGCGAGGSSQAGAVTQADPLAHAARAARTRPADWTAYHSSQARTGVDTTSPPRGRVRRSWTRRVDQQVYAEPLALGGRVYVATENDTVYALGARTGRVIWRRHLATPVDGSTLPCGNINPTGITGTPVINRQAGTLYAVANVRGYRHVLYALRLRDGRIRFHRRVDAPGSDPRIHQQRGALSLWRGRVYVPYGGLIGDCGAYKGRVVATGGRRPGRLYGFAVGVHREGAIWATSGAAIDRRGRVFVATGNGDSSGFDFGNAVIRLSPTLRRTGFFRPRNGAALNDADADLGSVGPTLISHNRLFQIGKEGVGEVISTDRLGGVGGARFARRVCSGAFGGLAYARPYVYVPCTDGLVAVRLGARNRFSVAWRRPGFFAGPPIVAGGLVWTIDTGSATLHGFTPRTGRQRVSARLGSVTHFPTPSAGGGRLFAPAGNGVVAFRGI